jgi:hypothetical protein
MLRIAERNVAPEGCYAKSHIYRNVYKEQQFCRAVGKNVTAKAFSFNKVPQLSTNGLQQVRYQSLKEPQISVDFNKGWNVVRDQGVGGSNPLSPTNVFNSLQSISGTPPTTV